MKGETVGFLLAALAFILLNVDVVPGNRLLGFVCFFMACGVFLATWLTRGRRPDEAD